MKTHYGVNIIRNRGVGNGHDVSVYVGTRLTPGSVYAALLRKGIRLTSCDLVLPVVLLSKDLPRTFAVYGWAFFWGALRKFSPKRQVSLSKAEWVLDRKRFE